VFRFQRLAVVTTVATFVLIALGGLVRATDSGLGCPDWPRCFGRLVPPAEFHAWVEHTHRLAAATVGLLTLLLVVAAWRTRQPARQRWATVGALALVSVQALIGAFVVWLKLRSDSVTLHLGTALAFVALVIFIAHRARHPAVPAPRRRPRSRFATLAWVTAGLVYAQMLVGSTVTGHHAGLAFPDFPLMNGSLIPELTRTTAWIQVGHRVLAFVVAGFVIATWLRARKDRPGQAVIRRLATASLHLVVVQIVLGAANVWGRLSALTVVPHLTVGALLWGTAFALALHARRTDHALDEQPGAGDAAEDPTTAQVAAEAADAGAAGTAKETATTKAVSRPAPSLRDTLSAYVRLTKPRIIELLLVTTVPTMFLAARGVPPLWLTLATLVGGTMSAGSANTINCYLDRDIDEKMRRTSRRPLPAHSVDPRHALVFGLVLGAAGFLWLWAFVNLLAGALATGAILFYVFVYTIGLKRRSTQNIVIGGAAGGVPVLVGWAAVTGRVEIPALVLFAVIFYWTPAHFWALSMRYVEDYRAAGVPMLPVVRGLKNTSQQIVYYTLLLVAVTLLLFPAARMGMIYLAAAVGLGVVFVWRAVQLAGDVSGKRAIRLFHFSNTYLALLFGAVVLDALVHVGV
jgi:protoheme IX farnesyltransferase